MQVSRPGLSLYPPSADVESAMLRRGYPPVRTGLKVCFTRPCGDEKRHFREKVPFFHRSEFLGSKEFGAFHSNVGVGAPDDPLRRAYRKRSFEAIPFRHLVGVGAPDDPPRLAFRLRSLAPFSPAPIVGATIGRVSVISSSSRYALIQASFVFVLRRAEVPGGWLAKRDGRVVLCTIIFHATQLSLSLSMRHPGKKPIPFI